MTINLLDNNPRIEYTVAQGVTQSAFVVPFEFFDDDDINVYVGSTLKTLTTHYTTADDSGNTQVHTSGSTGYVHFTSGNEVTGATGGTAVVITRDIDIDRITDFPTSGPFDISSLNTELDRMIAISADIKDTAERALILQDYDTTQSLELPDAATRANKILSFTATGDATVSQSIGIFQGSDATITTQDYLRHDLVKSTTSTELDNVYIAMQDSPSGTLLTNTTYWALVVDAVSAATSATNAASSAATAEGHKNNAEAAQTAAEAAQASAETAYDNFDDRYLGAKATDPSVDNDGDALIAGALYFNTTDGDMRVYNGSAWINVVSSLGNLANVVEDTTPQLGGTLDVNNQLVQFPDSTGASDNRLQLGSSQDMQLYHDGTANKIDTSASQELHVNSDDVLFYDNSGTTRTAIVSAGSTMNFQLYDNTGTVRVFAVNGSSNEFHRSVSIQDENLIRFKEATSNGSNYVAFKAPAAITANVVWTLPDADGTSGQLLSTNGGGDLTWVDEQDSSALAFAIALG